MLVVITCAVASVLHVETVVIHQFGTLCGDVTFALLGDSSCDEPLTGLEVVVQALGLIAFPSVLKLWVSSCLPCTINCVVCVDKGAIGIHAHEVSL